jgi:predicted permease
MILQDFSYAIRLLSKKPGFTALTTLVMAAGIGLSVYMFSFFNSILFKDLPFKDGESLVVISTSIDGIKSSKRLNLHDYLEIRNNITGLSEFGSFRNTDVIVSSKDGARRYAAVKAEENIFTLTRTKAMLGRGFTKAENKTGAEKIVVIGFELWQNLFQSDQNILDKTMRINGFAHRIIGVMPQGYLFPNIAKLWLPLREDATQLARGKSGDIRGLAHLEKGTSLEELNRQLTVIMQRVEQRYPETNQGISAYATSIPSAGMRDGASVVYSMHIVAILILILASINVANLLLSRAVERSKETAIRVALGAPRARLISQMLWESIIICTLGGVIGLLVMAWGLEITESIVATFFTDPPSFWWHFGLDAYTIKLFLAIVVGTIIVTGFVPAWKNSGGDFNAALRDGTRGALSKKSGRLNRWLVISEIFISMAVLIVAAVMVFGAYQQSHADIGVETDNILTARVLLTESKYADKTQQVKFINSLQSQLSVGTGIKDVMISSALPGDYSVETGFAIEGHEYNQKAKQSFPKAKYITVFSGALEKLGVDLQQGRYFNSSDDGLNKRSVLVSESFAKRHFNQDTAIGKRINIINNESNEKQWLLIVGVVENTIQGDREVKNHVVIYRPYSQAPRKNMTIAMKMSAEVSVVTQTLRKTLQSIDPQLPSFRIETYDTSSQRITAPLEFISKLTALFGLAAAFLAASGIYGVMSNTINQRTHEIGIKRALGADEKMITREFLMTGSKLLLWGGIPGILLGGFMGAAMSQTFGIDKTVIIFIAVTMITLIGSVVMFATYLPTQKALKLEPSQALHYE